MTTPDSVTSVGWVVNTAHSKYPLPRAKATTKLWKTKPRLPDSNFVEPDGGGAPPQMILKESRRFLPAQRKPQNVSSANGMVTTTFAHSGANGTTMAGMAAILGRVHTRYMIGE
jgi:hypothetical protein